MSDETNQTVARGDQLQKSVSTHTELRESQGAAKPAYLQQPDVIALPTIPAQQQGNSQPGASQSVANSNSSKGE